jgi:dTMP kinase
VNRGKLVVLEGVDGAGTTTQAERLGRRFGTRAHVTREPSTGPIGGLLRQLLGGAYAPVDRAAVALLFAADRLDHLAREIEPALERGQLVITDRYVLSSLAYQSIDLEPDFGGDRERARELVAAINARARSADLTLFLEVPADVAEARRRARGGPEELFDHRAFQVKLQAMYRQEVDRLLAQGAEVRKFDGTLAPDVVEDQVLAALKACFGPFGTPP